MAPPTTGPSHVAGCLKHIKWGLMPNFVGSILIPAKISGSISSHASPGCTVPNLRNPYLITLLCLSTRPLALGCAVLMILWSAPIPIKYFLNSPIYSLPRSVRTTRGTPKRQVILRWKALATALLANATTGHASTHFEAAQMHTTRYFTPPVPGGVNGPMLSIHQVSKGRVCLMVGQRCGGGLNLAPSTWEGICAVQSAIQSRAMPCQNQRCFNSS